MSDSELHDLLHERVADVTMPDVAERAWGRARRIRRRRTTAAIAGTVAAVVVTAFVVDNGPGLDRSERPVLPATRPAVPTPTPRKDAASRISPRKYVCIAAAMRSSRASSARASTVAKTSATAADAARTFTAAERRTTRPV